MYFAVSLPVRMGCVGFNSHIGSSGERARVAVAGNSTRISSAGDSSRIANSGMRVRVCTLGERCHIASNGDMVQLALARRLPIAVTMSTSLPVVKIQQLSARARWTQLFSDRAAVQRWHIMTGKEFASLLPSKARIIFAPESATASMSSISLLSADISSIPGQTVSART